MKHSSLEISPVPKCENIQRALDQFIEAKKTFLVWMLQKCVDFIIEERRVNDQNI